MKFTNFMKPTILALIATSVTACGDKLDCNSSSVKKNVIEIIQSHLDNAVWYNQMKIAIKGTPTIENITKVESSSNGNQAQCMGKYSITYNEKPRSIDFNYNLAYLEDKKDTEVKVNIGDVQSGLTRIVMMESPIKNGEEKIYDIHNGKLIAVRNWKKNVEDGLQSSYESNTGTLIHQYSMVDGKKNGIEKSWETDGTIVNEIEWKNGKANGLMHYDNSGKFLTSLKYPFPYKAVQLTDGVKNGVQKTYSVSNGVGAVIEIENFKNDKLDGVKQKFDSNGNVIFQVLYSQGVLVVNDTTTASSIKVCVEGWLDRKKNSGLYTWGSDQDRDKYFMEEFQTKCENGILP